MPKKISRSRKQNRLRFSSSRHSGERPATPESDSGQARMTFSDILLFLFIILLPTQFRKHFFLSFSYLSGVRVDYLAPTLFVTDLIALVILLLNVRRLTSFARPALFIILIGALNIFISLSGPLAIYHFLKLLEVVGIFFVFRNIKLKENVLLWGFLAGAVLEVGLAISHLVLGHSLNGIFYFLGERTISLSLPGIAKATLQGVEFLRPYATFSHPNSLAGFYLLVYAFSLTRTKTSAPLARYILLFLCTILVMITFSKVAILTFLLITLVYFATQWKKSTCHPCDLSRLTVGLAVAFAFLQATTDPHSIQKRIVLFHNALSIISSTPIVGVGLGNYLIAQNNLPHQGGIFPAQPVHNIFLLFTTETGIIATLALIVFFFMKNWRRLQQLAFLLCVLAVAGTGMFDHYWLTLQQNLLLMAVVFGVLTASSDRQQPSR